VARALTHPLVLGCAALLLASVAHAGTWAGDAASGRLAFTATQAGARFTGRFGSFHVNFDFDAEAPAQGRLHVTVVTASADTQDDDRDSILRTEDFFWSEHYPEAVFDAQGFERDGEGWLARGTLTLRGVTQPVVVRFTTVPAKDHLAMQGSTTLRRIAFGVGQGDWASTEWIGDEVVIAFDLSLRPPAGP
jgi:polyisoprenoid-binding protein YceI